MHLWSDSWDPKPAIPAPWCLYIYTRAVQYPFLWVGRAAPCHGYSINCIHTKSVIQFLHMSTIFTREVTNTLNWESFHTCEIPRDSAFFQDRNPVLTRKKQADASASKCHVTCGTVYEWCHFPHGGWWKITVSIGTSWFLSTIDIYKGPLIEPVKNAIPSHSTNWKRFPYISVVPQSSTNYQESAVPKFWWLESVPF